MFRKILISALLIGGLSATALGQFAPANDPQKQTLLKELITAMDLKGITEKSMEAQFAQMESSFPQMMIASYPNIAELPKEAQESFQKKTVASGIRAMKRMQELYAQKIDFGTIVEQIYLPIYDKHFSTEELKDLLKFYGSPTGKKFVANTPLFTQEALQKSNEVLVPRVIEILNQVMTEERARIMKELPPPKGEPSILEKGVPPRMLMEDKEPAPKVKTPTRKKK